MKVYLISGIAADSRLYRRIQLPSGFEAIYIEWLKPLRNESITAYALRLAEKIDHEEPFLLTGVSLGGIMATEISLRLRPLAVILIGSIPVFTQLPVYYGWLARFYVHKLIPGSLYKFSAKVKHLFTREKAEDKKVIMQMISETDPAFIRWGVQAVLKWRNTEIPKSLFHIHGTRDEIFPYSFTSPTHTIPKGDHSLVISKAGEVNHIISEILEQVQTQKTITLARI